MPNAQQGQFNSTFLDCLPLPGSLAPDRDSQTQARIPQPTLVCSNRLFQGGCRIPSCTSCFKRSAHDQRSTTLPSRNFRISDSRQIVSLACRRKTHEASGLYAGHREPAYNSIPSLKYVFNREQGTFLAGQRFAQAPLYRATMPALSSGSAEYPCNSTLASYIFRYPSRSPAFQFLMAFLKISRLVIGLIVKKVPRFARKPFYGMKAWQRPFPIMRRTT